MRILLAIIAAIVLAACSREKQDSCLRPEVRERIVRMDSLAKQLSPQCLREVEVAKRQAKDSIEWHFYHQCLAGYYQLSPTPDSLVPIADEVIAFAQRQEPKTPIIYSLLASAYESKAVLCQRYQFTGDEALRLRSTAYGYMQRSCDKERLPDLCGNMGDFYMFRSDMPQAAAWYRRALFLADSLSLPPVKSASLYVGLATIYTRIESYRQAEDLFRKAEPYYDEFTANMQIYYLTNLGNLYYYSGNYKSAKDVFQKLERMLTSLRVGGADLAVCQIDLADICLNLGNISEAESYLEPADKFFRRAGMTAGIFYANSIRIGMAAKSERTIDIRPLLDGEAFSWPTEYGLLSIRYRYLRDYYRRRGQWREALDIMERSDHLRDSVASANNFMRTAEMAQRFREDTLKLHHNMLMQKTRDDLRDSRTAIALLVLVAAAIAAASVMYYRRKRTQAEMNITQLRLANARNRISPHFVFNVLNNYMAGRSEQEQQQLLTLVKLIRANLNITRNTFVSLADEMAFVRRYIEVEGELLGPDFQYTERIAPEADPATTMLPAMCVQILAENAIKHGLRLIDGPRRMAIEIEADAGRTTIKVQDNGRGFDIRAYGKGTRTGLDILRHTERIVNQQLGRQALHFDIRNRKDDAGNILGCEAAIVLDKLTPTRDTPL